MDVLGKSLGALAGIIFVGWGERGLCVSAARLEEAFEKYGLQATVPCHLRIKDGSARAEAPLAPLLVG